MRKREFLRELSERISHIEKTERENIITYYDELIEDTIDRTGYTEEQVIYNLGTMNEIVRKLNVSNIENNYKKINADDILDEEVNNVEETKVEDTKKEESTKNTNKPVKKERNIGLYILLIIITFPIWIGLICGILGVTIGVFVGGIAAMFGFVVASIALVISGLAVIVVGILSISTAYGIFLVGSGLIMIGIGILLSPIMIKLFGFVIKVYMKLAKWIINQINRLIGKRKKVLANEN